MWYLRLLLKNGLAFWLQFSCILGVTIYFVSVCSSIAGIDQPLFKRLIDLSANLTIFELILLFMLGPILFSRVANLFALVVTIYFAERVFLGAGLVRGQIGPLVFLGATSVLALLGDLAPWQKPTYNGHISTKLRVITIAILSFCFLAMGLYTLVQHRTFANWLSMAMGLQNDSWSLIFPMFVLVSWGSLVIGHGRRSIMLFAAFPSLLVLAFVSQWPSYLLVVPFTMCISLAFIPVFRN